MTTRPTALLLDLYQLTMAHAYFELGMNETAVFEMFVRRLPASRGFLIAAGLEQALEYLQQLRFTDRELEFLDGLGTFPHTFLDYLSQVRFSGDVDAMREGTPFFADEPILRITAPLLEAQLVESRLLNILHFQTLIASKAARCVLVADGRRLIDFGMRRAHEADAGLYAARAAYLAGFDATATVAAGLRFGIPLSGTMAHSFIEAHDSELEAFRHFVKIRPAGTTLLIDTYDSERAAHRVVELAQELRQQGAGITIDAVRLDSGDLAAQAHAVRRILDEGDCRSIRIAFSGGLDEHEIERFVQTRVPVEVFGVGTSLDISADAPSLDMAYKLQEYAGKPRRKRSPGKLTWPGAKQVFRSRGSRGEALQDRIALADEQVPGDPLLERVLSKGSGTRSAPDLHAIREYCQRELQSLPAGLRKLSHEQDCVSVEISAGVRALAMQSDAAIS
jgi:nicotinate phosphoribosyltransferase